MEREKRSWEFAAVPLLLLMLGVLALVFWAATAGLWIWVALGVVAAVAMVAGALVLTGRRRHERQPAVPTLPRGAAPHVDDGVHRVLVILDGECEPGALGQALAARSNGRPTEVLVVAPALGSRTARWTGDESAYRNASDHLEAALVALAAVHVRAHGHVGSHDPLAAAEDGLREFPADEILFVVRSPGTTNWLEQGVVDRARGRYPLPVAELATESS